ncbi:MAG: enoyl-CoA hydratase [Dehalococcoidales bacterium]|nr:enoyl-CoA hydratase [Dehalococcoidales bacterium]
MDFVKVKKEQGVTTLILSHPEIRNALDGRMSQSIAQVFEELRDDEETKVVVLCGEGKAFCAGGDIKDLKNLHDNKTPLETRDSVRRMMLRVLGGITGMEKPVIAMVRGPAVGAGFNLALACDMIIASDNAMFGELFVRVGLASDYGGSYLVTRLVGLAKAKELFMTGKMVDAKEAERIGLINQVVPDAELEKTVYALANQLAAGPTRALGIIKTQLNTAVDKDLKESLEAEAHAFGMLIHSDDHAEGIAAFFEKRPPKFKGK